MKCNRFYDYICLYIFSDDLLANPGSFIYGQSPSSGNVPIYAMVTMCNLTVQNNDPEGRL